MKTKRKREPTTLSVGHLKPEPPPREIVRSGVIDKIKINCKMRISGKLRESHERKSKTRKRRRMKRPTSGWCLLASVLLVCQGLVISGLAEPSKGQQNRPSASWPSSGLKEAPSSSFRRGVTRTVISSGQPARFSLEPEAQINYLASSGVAVPCRAAPSTSGHQDISTELSWRLVNHPPTTAGAHSSKVERHELLPAAHLSPTDTELVVRRDGALLIRPTGSDAVDTERSRDFRCCLANKFGSLCSRLVQVRAVANRSLAGAQPRIAEVFDEMVLAGNSVALRCSLPDPINHELVGWLREEQVIWHRKSSFAIASIGHRSTSGQVQPTNNSWRGTKFVVLDQQNELLIRNTSRRDARANYRCQVRSKLTGEQLISEQPARLLLDESAARRPVRLGRPRPEVAQPTWAQLHEQVHLCSHLQAQPRPRLVWFFEPEVAEESSGEPKHRKRVRVDQLESDWHVGPLEGELSLDMSPCLTIRQVQLRHQGVWMAEAASGLNSSDSQGVLRSVIRLKVFSNFISVQLMLSSWSSTSGSPSTQTTIRQQQQQQPTTTTTTNLLGQMPTTTSLIQPSTQLLLNCSISGQPVKSVLWFRNAQPIASFDLEQHGDLSHTGSGSATTRQFVEQPFEEQHLLDEINFLSPTQLEIRHFRPGIDRGLYQCYAQSWKISGSGSNTEDNNLRRNSNWAAVQLEPALAKPELLGAHSSSSSSSSSSWAADSPNGSESNFHLDGNGWITLSCLFTGQPEPQISWFLDGELVGVDESTGSSWSAISVIDREPTSQLDQIVSSQNDEQMVNYKVGPQWHPSRIAGIEVVPQTGATSGNTQTTTSSQLNISRPLSGLLRCEARNQLGRAYHESQMSVGVEGISVTPTRQTQAPIDLVAGRAGRLVCPVHASSGQTIVWYRGEERLSVTSGVGGSQRRRLIGDGRQLEISQVDPEADRGTYRCRLDTGGSGSLVDALDPSNSTLTEFKMEVRVRMEPLIDRQSLPAKLEATEGMRTKLVCSVVQGEQPLEIRWFRRRSWWWPGWWAWKQTTSGPNRELDGYQLVENSADDSVAIHQLDDSCLMTLRQVSWWDSGDYLCVAENAVAQSTRRTKLEVRLAPSWSQEPPDQLHLLLGSRAHLECFSHSLPVASIQWRRLSADSEWSSTTGSVNVTSQALRWLPNGTLIFEQVQLEDAGELICELTNGIGAGLAKKVHLHVDCPPQLVGVFGTTSGPRSNSPRRQFARLNEPAELRCRVQGDTPLRLTWTRLASEGVEPEVDSMPSDIRRAQKSISGRLVEATLTVSRAQRNHSGVYWCGASNQFGWNEWPLELVVQEPPERPQLLRPIRIGPRQALLAFRAPFDGHAPIRRYSIQYRRLSSSFGPSWAISGGFEGGQQQSEQEGGSWQEIQLDSPLVISSPDETEQHRVASITTSGSTSTLTSARLENGGGFNGTGSGGQDLVQLNLCCLQPYSRYFARIRAVNELGESEPSNQVDFMTDEEAIGGPPLEVSVEPTGAHSLKVRWRPPARQLQNGLIRGYYIGYRANGNPRSSSPGAVTPTTVHRDVSGDPLTALAIHTQTASTGDEQLEQQFQYKNVQIDSFQLPATSPLQLAVVATGNGSLNSSNQPPLSSYLTNLRRKTSYSVIVQAYNKLGAGPRSDMVSVWTLDAAPPMSPNLKLLSVSHDSARLIWFSRRPGSRSDNSQSLNQSNNIEQTIQLEQDHLEIEQDEPGSFYTLNFRSQDRHQMSPGNSSVSSLLSAADSSWQQRRISRQPSSQQPYVLSGLRCGSQHLAFVTATNSLGQSEPGETLSFRTLGHAPIAPWQANQFVQLLSSTGSESSSTQQLNLSSTSSSASYVDARLRLSTWHEVGCPISVFVVRFRLEFSHPNVNSNNNKWTVIDHRPTRTGSLPADLTIRRLLSDQLYRLSVEAASEAGSTLAEYQFDTGPTWNASTLGVWINGLAVDPAADLQLGQQSDHFRPEMSPDFGSSGDTVLDFAQRASNSGPTGNRDKLTSLGLWSLTVVFVLASGLMVIISLVVGVRSLLRSGGGHQRDNNDGQHRQSGHRHAHQHHHHHQQHRHNNSPNKHHADSPSGGSPGLRAPVDSLLCCLSGGSGSNRPAGYSSAASSSSSTGADSSSGNQTTAGTGCYQLGGHAHLYHQDDQLSSAAGIGQFNYSNCSDGLKTIALDSLPVYKQPHHLIGPSNSMSRLMPSGSLHHSLATSGSRMASVRNNSSTNNNYSNSNNLYNSAQPAAADQLEMSAQHPASTPLYAATLGKLSSHRFHTFGRLVQAPKAPTSSGANTSGYESSPGPCGGGITSSHSMYLSSLSQQQQQQQQLYQPTFNQEPDSPNHHQDLYQSQQQTQLLDSLYQLDQQKNYDLEQQQTLSNHLASLNTYRMLFGPTPATETQSPVSNSAQNCDQQRLEETALYEADSMRPCDIIAP